MQFNAFHMQLKVQSVVCLTCNLQLTSYNVVLTNVQRNQTRALSDAGVSCEGALVENRVPNSVCVCLFIGCP